MSGEHYHKKICTLTCTSTYLPLMIGILPNHRDLYNRFPNKHRSQDQPTDLFSTPKKEQNETYGVNDVGFLQLKTPGVFHGDKVDISKVNSFTSGEF